MLIGKIVSSTSHIEYVCQVYGPGEVETAPEPQDYGFGSFVDIEQPDGSHLVGVIYDTTLLNPEFGSLGPRLSPQEDLAVFSPDYLQEKVTLVAVVVLGSIDDAGLAQQGVPAVAPRIDARVHRLDREQIRRFHQARGTLRVSYFPMLATMPSPLAPHLLLQIMSSLCELFPEEAQRLQVLSNNLSWKCRVEPAE